MLEVRRSKAKSSEAGLEVTVHHPLRTADSYLTTAVVDSSTRQTRMGSGRFTKEERSQPKVERKPGGNIRKERQPDLWWLLLFSHSR